MPITSIPITERCNMSCAHCLASCTAQGKDMSWGTYIQAIKASMDSPIITLTGGEPTLHPHFMEMLEYAISKRPKGTIGVVTNGSNAELSLKLADMTEQGIIYASISQDQWHDPIEDVVVSRFKNIGGKSYIQTTAKNNKEVIAAGRGANIEGARDECAGKDLSLDVEGNVFLCDCKKECIGTIWNYTIPNLHCECIAPALESGEYVCAGYCSVRGHIIVKNPEPIKKLHAINAAEIEVLSLLVDYQDGKVLPWDIKPKLTQLAMDEQELTAEEFLAIVDKYWGTNCLARIT